LKQGLLGCREVGTFLCRLFGQMFESSEDCLLSNISNIKEQLGYNPFMARGWESKSVEAQQAEAADDKNEPKQRLTAEQAARVRQLEGVQLSRKRVLQQLETTRDPRRREMLTAALAELDKQIHYLDEV